MVSVASEFGVMEHWSWVCFLAKGFVTLGLCFDYEHDSGE